MTEFLEVAKVVAQWSPTTLLALVIVLILRGNLITSRQYNDSRADWQQQIASKDEEIRTWRDAHAKSEDVRGRVSELLASQTNDMKTILLFIQQTTRDKP